MPRPRLYAGADQPPRLGLEIDAIDARGQRIPILTQDVLQTPFCALTMLARTDKRNLPQVLVLAPLSGHFPILLRDLVVGLLPDFEVYYSDWVNARHIPRRCGPFDLAANIYWFVDMIECLGPRPNIIALCQAGVPAVMAAAHLAETNARIAPSSLVLIAAPIDPTSNPTRVVRLIRARSLSWYERNVIMPVAPAYRGEGRLVYPAEVQLLGLQAYLARHLTQSGELMFKLMHDDGLDPQRFPFLDLYSALMDLPAEVFLDIVRHIYQERSIWRGALKARGVPVDFSAMRSTALMTVEGENDDIAAPGQTQRAHDLCVSVPNSNRRQLLVPGCGHFSLFHGNTWRTRILPEVRAFIRAQNHSGQP
ncbi:MAG: polyhydroxyalkanoate depolymerase [Hyphomicrobiaceae bacterium]